MKYAATGHFRWTMVSCHLEDKGAAPGELDHVRRFYVDRVGLQGTEFVEGLCDSATGVLAIQGASPSTQPP